MQSRFVVTATLFACFTLVVSAAAETHPPMRPLPAASDRPIAKGPALFVDVENGSDEASGSKVKPWRTINHALRMCEPGETVYLRGGTYYEHVVLPHSGKDGKPITLRSFPGELAVIDGGLQEFCDHPQDAWVPLTDSAKDEFVSTKSYPQFAVRPIVSSFPPAGWEPFYGKEGERPVVLGHFVDSMVPLHGYRTLADLRDDSMLWDVENKFDKEQSVYCGPGLWFNRKTLRIHIRLAHCSLAGLGDRAYRGETDPRKVPLCISGPYGSDVVRINGANHVVLQDLVLRGASGSALINLYGSDDVAFDGLTCYGGAPHCWLTAQQTCE